VSRPAVSVVMPFAGTADEAREACGSLLTLELHEGDELIVADNSAGAVPATPGVTVVRALGERSPAHARNAGAEHAAGDWVLFLDADCRPPAGLLDAYFATPVDSRVGALAGAVVPAAGAEPRSLAARYGAARNFLSLEAHLAHPFRPRAVAANLLVRRTAFAELGGFFEGLRAAEDTDFSWRLQAAGWRLEGRPEAAVEHHYRATLTELRGQWRGYAAGRAWLTRRYPEFGPEPAVVRAARRVVARAGGEPGPGPGATPRVGTAPRAYLALDALLALDELAGFVLSNRPAHEPPPPADLVLVGDRFPTHSDALVERVRAFRGARIEAARRPDAIDRRAASEVLVDYREDDGIRDRVWALAWLVLRHPVRCSRSLVEKAEYMAAFSTRPPPAPGLLALAPAALRLARDRGARVRALDPRDPADAAVARRLAALAGAPLDDPGTS
jgi:GT2 family glycosyltransferase